MTGTRSVALAGHLVDGREELLAGQVAGGAEEDEGVGRRRARRLTWPPVVGGLHARGRPRRRRVLGQDGVAAELVAQGGDDPHGRALASWLAKRA